MHKMHQILLQSHILNVFVKGGSNYQQKGKFMFKNLKGRSNIKSIDVFE